MSEREKQELEARLASIEKMAGQEVDSRLAEISAEIEQRGAELTPETIEAREKEVIALKARRKALTDAAEKRLTLLNDIASGAASSTVIRTFSPDGGAGMGGNDLMLRNALGVGAGARSTDGDRYATPEYRKAFMDYALRGREIPVEYRADAITATTDVGAAIPTTVLNQIIEKMEATGMILPLVTRTSYKGGVQIPSSSVKPVASWVAEGAGSDKQKKPVDGVITFAYYKLRCAVAVTLEVETMAMSVFENTLVNNVVEAMIKGVEQAIISGTGTGQPEGILTKTPPAKQALTVAAPAYSDLINAEAALPQAYENGAVWCMSKKTFMQYYGLTDESGQPVGRVNYGIAGKPERSLLGRTVIVNDYVTSFDTSIANGTKFAFLFNFRDYILNTNYAMGIKKYEDNDTDDTITRAVMLVDGKVVDVNSLVTLAKAAS